MAFFPKKKDHQWSLIRISSGFNTFHILKQNLAKKLDTYMREFADNAKVIEDCKSNGQRSEEDINDTV